MRELQLYRHPIVWGSCLIGALVALMAPEDVLQRYDWLRAWYEWLARTIPSVPSFAQYSKFPEVTSAYFAVMWVLAIPVGLYLIPRGEALVDGERGLRNFGGPRRYLVIGTILCGSGIFIFVFMDIGLPWNMFPIHSSRVALAILGPLFVLAPVNFLASYVGIWKVCRKIFLGEKKHVME